MNPLVIRAKAETTPAVTFDSENNIFEISGYSHPEDAVAFYFPILDWLKIYEECPNIQTDFHFKFRYYNTASAKEIFRIVSSLEEAAKKSKVTVHWHYEEEDTDMLAASKRFEKMSIVPFTFIADRP